MMVLPLGSFVLCVLTLSLSSVTALASQTPLYSPRLRGASHSEDWFDFENSIRRVAVIGAGPGGLLHASTLIEEGFEVRLFERAPRPGGQWLYTDKTPVHAAFPNRPIDTSGFVPDIPNSLPSTRIYVDGDGGLTNDWRMREHWNPTSAWAGLTSTVPPAMMTFPGVEHAPGTPWHMPHKTIQRYVRQYASHIGLNSNDEESANITSYSTRVERVEKLPGAKQWTLTLRKMTEIPNSRGKLRVDWWTEKFDAVVVGTDSEADSPWVPPIPGLNEWAHAYPDRIYHGREHRRPEHVAGKNVLVVGGSISGSGIASDISGHVKSVMASIRLHPNKPALWDKTLLRLFPNNMTFVPEIEEFSRYTGRSRHGVRDVKVKLMNGTVLSGFDHIILATGYRYSFPFLTGLHNSSIVGFAEPETKVPPVITDGTHRRSLHWTGHYIADPTLGFASYEPWELGPYQALGFAKSWSRKARLPSTDRMWKSYPGAGRDLTCRPGQTEYCHKLFVQWLNEASIEFGGRLITPLPTKNFEGLSYFLEVYLGPRDTSFRQRVEKDQNTPRAEWPARNGSEWQFAGTEVNDRVMRDEQEEEIRRIPHWAELSERW